MVAHPIPNAPERCQICEGNAGPSDPPAAVPVDRIATSRTGIGSQDATRLWIVDPEIKRRHPATAFQSGCFCPPVPQGRFPIGGRSSAQSESAMIHLELQAAASGCPFVPAVLKIPRSTHFPQAGISLCRTSRWMRRRVAPLLNQRLHRRRITFDVVPEE